MEGDRSGYQRPKVIELKAISDVEDIRNYRIDIYISDSNGDGEIDIDDNASSYELNKTNNFSDYSISKGEFMYLYDDYGWATNHLANSGPDNNFDFTKVKSYRISNLYSQLTGWKPISLSKRDSLSSSDWTKVDYLCLLYTSPSPRD